MSPKQQFDPNVLFKIKRKRDNNIEIVNETSNVHTDDVETVGGLIDENDVNILCIICKNSKIGAAYYSFGEKLLYVYEELTDVPSQFLVSRALYREVDPTYILSFGSIADDFIKVLIDTVSRTDTTVTSDGVRSLPQNFFLLPPKEYSYEICKAIIFQLKVASSCTETCPVKREIYMHSLIDFDHRLSVQAVGALVKYLDKNWAHFETNQGDLQFLHIHQVSMKNHILIDTTSFSALQVFNQRSHDSSFKRGIQSSNREGLSIFKLFSEYCKSKLGQTCVKNLLLHPIKDIGELHKRLDFIAFVLQPINRDFIESLQDNIKQLSEINRILIKIQNSQANNLDWHVLYKTIYHSVFINELCGPYREKSILFTELHNGVSSDLIGLEQSINNCLDFTAGSKRGRPVIKFGLDENLDAKKLRQQDISKHVTAAARIAANDLPDFLNECAVVYLPEMGHLIAIKEWEPNCNPDQLQEWGFQFMFTLRGTIHYKNPLCVELDKRLGDITAEIIDHENRILRRLTGFVLKYNKDIREPLKVLSLVDCLISMAKVAIRNNFVRPKLNIDNVIAIEEGRHPLMELIVTGYARNDFYSGGNCSRMKIITGPNGSGKSIYLKQIAIIVYLGHVGSYVPAKSANIGLVHSIHSRMQATESASVRLSAFMIDISQATQALHHVKSSSLVIMDEFGRGTSGSEGIAFLVSVLKKFLRNDGGCPHVLVSTHFHQVTEYLPESVVVEHMKMEHTQQDGRIYFLFKVATGVSESFAFEIASAFELDADIVARAKDIFRCLKNNEPIQPIFNRRLGATGADFTMQLEIPEPDD